MSDDIPEACRQAASIALFGWPLTDASKHELNQIQNVAQAMHAYAVAYAAEQVREEMESVEGWIELYCGGSTAEKFRQDTADYDAKRSKP
jgi:hypothetical protein